MMASLQDFMTHGDSNCKLTDIQFFEENGQYFFRLKYRYEDDRSVSEIMIPKLCIPIAIDRLIISKEKLWSDYTYTADIGFGHCYMCAVMVNGESTVYAEKIIKEKTKEMTVSEIEKQLGYKIKIISEDIR